MTETGVVAVALAIVGVTSLLSGIFGLLGGFLLVGMLIAIFDLTTSNLLISTVLIAATLWRTFVWFDRVRWRFVLLSTSGGTAAFLVIIASGLSPSRALILIVLGATPLLVTLLPKHFWPNIDTRIGQLICGFIVGLCQISGAASAAVVDIFFQNSVLNRIENVALKGALVIPILVFRASFFSIAEYRARGTITSSIPLWVYPSAVLIGIVATHVGGVVLTKMVTDKGFFTLSWRLSRLASAGFLAQGLWLLWRT